MHERITDMAMKIKCACGVMYDDTFKFCPECATPNPRAKKKTKSQETSSEKNETQQPQTRGRFTKIGESSVPSSPIPSPAKAIRKPIVTPAEPEEDYEDEIEEDIAEEEPDLYDDTDYEDAFDSEDEVEYEDEDESEEDYEDEASDEDDEYEYEEHEDDTSYSLKARPLSAVPARTVRHASSSVSKKPKTKPISSTKSSLGKNKKTYDPNFDGYYDDRLPAILDEVTKTTHIDVILKISLAIICIAALITYCIFYVQV